MLKPLSLPIKPKAKRIEQYQGEYYIYIYIYIYIHIHIYIYNNNNNYYYYYYYYYCDDDDDDDDELNEKALYAIQSFILFKQSSGIHFIYLFSKKQKEKLYKIPTNMPVETFYQTNAKTTNLYCPS